MVATQSMKLGLTSRTRLRLSEPPMDWRLEVAHPEPRADVRDPLTMVIAFFRQASELSERMAGLAAQIFPDGTIWAAWPRRAGGHQSDITDQAVRSAALSVGLVDVKVAALDSDWSALKLVWRTHLRK
jgi:hypothetical protein